MDVVWTTRGITFIHIPGFDFLPVPYVEYILVAVQLYNSLPLSFITSGSDIKVPKYLHHKVMHVIWRTIFIMSKRAT